MLLGTDVFDNLITYILNPLILLIFSFGFLVFLWGLLELLWNGSNPVKSNEGKQHMIWGVVGMFIMTAVGGIINLIVSTFGLTLPPNVSANGSVGGPTSQYSLGAVFRPNRNR